jgi:hypothetical protein
MDCDPIGGSKGGQGGGNLLDIEPNLIALRPTNRTSSVTPLEAAMFEFQLFGLVFSVLFFGAMVAGNPRISRR